VLWMLATIEKHTYQQLQAVWINFLEYSATDNNGKIPDLNV
jgi:hypothetical protein